MKWALIAVMLLFAAAHLCDSESWTGDHENRWRNFFTGAAFLMLAWGIYTHG